MATTTHAFHDRFAAELRELLGEGFEVGADRSLTFARFGSAALILYTPDPVDRRKPVRDDESREWVLRAAAKLRSEIPKYTDEAKESATLLLDELARRGL